MKTQLYLARHGQTRWNELHRFQGQLDSKLTPKGISQSQSIAKNLTANNIELIISSPLGRATASANICQQELNVPSIAVDTLAERDLGIWQGKYIEDIEQQPQYDEILHQYT